MWKQGCSTSLLLFQDETRLLKAKSCGNKVAQAQIRWKQACSTSIMLFQEETRLLKPKSGGNKLAQHQLFFSQEETRLLKPKSGGNKLAQHQLCYSKMKQGCSSPNQVKTSLLNISYAFPRVNKVGQAQIRWKQACSTSVMLFQEETRLLEPKSGGNKLAQHQLCYSKRKQGCSSPNQVETSLLNINYAFPRGTRPKVYRCDMK